MLVTLLAIANVGLPVAKSETVLGWSSTEIENECQEEQRDNGDNLDTGKHELSFTVDGHSEDVQGDDNNDEDGDPDSGVDFLVPKADDNCGGRNFSAERNRRLVPRIPSHSETHRRVDVTRAVLRNSTGKGQPCCHLSETLHHGENSDTSEGITC